jgi:arginyl-tRNA synthetase
MPEYLNFIENIMHFEDCKNSYYVNYSISRLSSLINDKVDKDEVDKDKVGENEEL